jgi:dihydrofolate reductase
MDEKRAIGRENRLPWHLPMDLKRFRAITLGHPVIMGRKTYESIGHPLPGRTNIVITRQDDFCPDGCVVVHDLQAALAECSGAEEVFILGGAEIFREALPLADRLYLTIVHTRIDGDAFFPEVPETFTIVSRETAGDVYPIEFLVYERREPKGSG